MSAIRGQAGSDDVKTMTRLDAAKLRALITREGRVKCFDKEVMAFLAKEHIGFVYAHITNGEIIDMYIPNIRATAGHFLSLLISDKGGSLWLKKPIRGTVDGEYGYYFLSTMYSYSDADMEAMNKLMHDSVNAQSQDESLSMKRLTLKELQGLGTVCGSEGNKCFDKQVIAFLKKHGVDHAFVEFYADSDEPNTEILNIVIPGTFWEDEDPDAKDEDLNRYGDTFTQMIDKKHGSLRFEDSAEMVKRPDTDPNGERCYYFESE